VIHAAWNKKGEGLRVIQSQRTLQKKFGNLLTPSIYYPLQSLIHSHWEKLL